VADKLVVRVEISQIVEHDERVEKCDSCKEQQLRRARDHSAVSWFGTGADLAGSG
jgi:ribosomal protein L37AE/L43A